MIEHCACCGRADPAKLSQRPQRPEKPRERKIMRKSLVLVGVAAMLAASSALAPAVAAPRNDLNVSLQLEPPNLDPTTGGAASAIREVTYANIFEGLTRIDATGSVQPDLAKS